MRSLSIADHGYERAAENVGTSPLKEQLLVSLLSFVFLLQSAFHNRRTVGPCFLAMTIIRGLTDPI